jgi:hypothetical protein
VSGSASSKARPPSRASPTRTTAGNFPASERNFPGDHREISSHAFKVQPARRPGFRVGHDSLRQDAAEGRQMFSMLFGLRPLSRHAVMSVRQSPRVTSRIAVAPITG